ncbi:MAG: L-histidine N(alpha)-methyltransferase [Burkholderiaceae bacterium]|nr:L-histidine N(alpha)-methyltransferase [Sulfuritalea sp.]MCF8175776.1 L-histidine N(alpha)-methyltransferase [Burkholderiaceae bacterium]
MTEAPIADTREIIGGLLRPVACIAPKYFYDARGSLLFEEITRLPEYYPTRTERAIMLEHGAEIAGKVGAGSTVIEMGAGSCEKARDLCELIRPAHFVAIDISAEFLHQAADGLRAAFPDLDIRVLAADLTADMSMPSDLSPRHRLVFYPGSSIGNFDPPQALSLLSRFRRLLGEDGTLLIGVDLLKDAAVLEAAYDDAAGVTAAFNLNVLNHVNRLIDSDFDPGQWRHRAIFNALDSRVEMHLEATLDIQVSWPGAGRRFLRGERIHTENSYKYRIEDFADTLGHAGFRHTDVWTDAARWFAVILARP